MKRLVLTLMLAAVLGGCTATAGGYPEPSTAFTREAECARNGGRWHAGVGAYAFCEFRQ